MILTHMVLFSAMIIAVWPLPILNYVAALFLVVAIQINLTARK